MYVDQRVLFNDSDVSWKVNDYRQGELAFVALTTDKLHIGAIHPFNNIFIEVGVANTNPVLPTLQIWYGSQWLSCVDVIDETLGLTQSGRITFQPAKDKGWQIENYSEDVPGLESTSIYNMYWLRISWDADLSSGTSLKYIGQKFSNDDILQSFYPDLLLPSMKDAFETGKTSWDEQHYMAAEHIVRDLKKNGIISYRGQLLDYSIFVDASCHKVAEIIYQAFGQPYFEQRQVVSKEYVKSLAVGQARIDKNLTGRLEPIEKILTTNFLTR